MDLRVGVCGGVFLLLAVFDIASAPGQPGPDKDKSPLPALFDGVPADLRAKVRDNPVRCDRVNDWLQENVNGKGRAIEVRVGIKEVIPNRRESAYIVYLNLTESKANLLDADWQVVFSDRNMPATKNLGFTGKSTNASQSANFAFEGVNAVDAERLADLKSAVIKGKVKEARLSRINSSTPAVINIILEDVAVEGNKWTQFKGPGTGFGVAGDPFGGAGGKKSPKNKVPDSK